MIPRVARSFISLPTLPLVLPPAAPLRQPFQTFRHLKWTVLDIFSLVIIVIFKIFMSLLAIVVLPYFPLDYPIFQASDCYGGIDGLL